MMFAKLFVVVMLAFPVLAQINSTSAATPTSQVAAIEAPAVMPLVGPSVASPAAVVSSGNVSSGNVSSGNVSSGNVSSGNISPSHSLVAAGDPGEQTPGRTLYRWSLAAVVAANVADIATSWSGPETNPVIAGGGRQFGTTSVVIKSGFLGASLLIQHYVLRHRPDFYQRMAWLNFATTGVQGGIAAHNASLR